MITMIDYDAGNMKSVEKALLHLGEEVQVTRRAEDILCADKVILPGVGNFGSAMGKLDEYGLTDVIRQVCEKGTPFLGICLGLQLLFEESAESPGVKGLGILPGKICRIPKASGLKIPHMGWNALHLPRTGRMCILYILFICRRRVRGWWRRRRITVWGSTRRWNGEMYLPVSSIRRRAGIWGLRSFKILQGWIKAPRGWADVYETDHTLSGCG